MIDKDIGSEAPLPILRGLNKQLNEELEMNSTVLQEEAPIVPLQELVDAPAHSKVSR